MLRRGRDEEAWTHLNRIIPVMEMDFPRVIAECDLAILELRRSALGEARERVNSLLDVIEDVGIRDASRRVRQTAAIIEFVAGSRDLSLQRLQEAEGSGIMSADSSSILGAIRSGDLTAETALACYPDEYLQYWSQNPLKMLPAETLTPQAVFEDVA